MTNHELTSEKAMPRNDAMLLPVPVTRSLPVFWAGRYLIVGGTLTAFAVATVVAFLLPKTFESSVPLILMPTPIKQAGDAVSALIPRVLSVTDYEILLTSDGTLKEVADKVRQLGTWPERDLEALEEISRLRRRMRVQVEITEKTAYGVARSPVMLLKARAHTPEQACDLAQAWGEVAEELANRLYQKGKTGLKDFVQTRFADTRQDLLSVRAQIRDLEIEWNDELEHERMAKTHSRLLNYEEKAIDLAMKIEATKTELEELRARLAKEPEKKVLWKSPPMTAVFLQEQVSANKTELTPQETKQPGYQDEVLNETYIYLKHKVTLMESELAGMEKHLKIMLDSKEALEQELQQLRAETAHRSFERKQLDQEESPLKHSYDLLASKLEQAKIAETEEAEMADIKIVADAVAPDRKIRPIRSLIMAMGAIMGLLLSASYVWARALLMGLL